MSDPEFVSLSDGVLIADEQWFHANGDRSDQSTAAIDFTPIRAFADVDEPSAEPLATDHEGGAAIPADAFILIYGDGGAGKTTLSIDLACHLAAGKPWLDLINPVRPLRIALIENEGPRAMFRRKLRAKLEHGWQLNSDEIVVLNEPWQAINLRESTHRTELVDALSSHRTDLLIAGPLSRLGMQGGGTLDEISVFSAYLTDIQHRMENPLTILLIHHENRAGRISGAWEGIPDTLIHIQAQGHGSTRVYWQKLRWGSHLHGKSTNLKWAQGETFTIDDEPMLDDNDLGDLITNAVRDNPGAGWNEILQAMKDANPDGLTRPERLKTIRDRLLKSHKLANEGTANRFKLYTAAEHPIIPRFPDSQAGIDSGIADSPSPVGKLPRVTDSPIPDYRRESVTRESPRATSNDPHDDIPF
jgi:hypothetical protein